MGPRAASPVVNMASPVTESHHHNTLASPPPVYLRSSPPPQPSDPPPPVPLRKEDGAPQQARIPDPHAVPKRKPISIPPLDDMQGNAVMQNTPLSPVLIDSPSAIPQASSAQIEDARSPDSPGFDDQRQRTDRNDNSNAEGHALPPRGGSLLAAASPSIDNPPRQYLPYRAKPAVASEIEMDSRQPQRKDSLAREAPLVQDNMGQPVAPESNEQQDRATISSGSSIVSVQQENGYHQPLQYHHQPFQEHLRNSGNRASKSTIMTGGSDSSSTDQVATGNYLAPGKGRASGLGIPRPASAYSDFVGRGRTGSPQLSPYLSGRNASSHSLTPPDTRPSSFVDLINAPYPQPAPAPATLKNSHLRPSVGNNASLLSHKQTFDMYLANVKKTNDPGTQYEFAVFMVASAQELGDQEDKNPEAITKLDLFREAKYILQRLSDRSYPYAQYYMGDGLATGLFNKGKPDHEKAFPLFVAASKHGHAEAGYRAALCFEFGWGCRQDGAKAVQFYRQAASKNHPGAMGRLGRACLAGEMGLNKRYREGITWLKRAAESADPQYNAAPYELGVLHETGYGDDVFPDESYAAQLFTRAAELGHPEGNYRMGDAYEHGKLGCPRDPALSVHFYTEAAQLGHPLAMMALCAWFMVGAEPILDKDEGEAFEWAKRAAEWGEYLLSLLFSTQTFPSIHFENIYIYIYIYI